MEAERRPQSPSRTAFRGPKPTCWVKCATLAATGVQPRVWRVAATRSAASVGENLLQCLAGGLVMRYQASASVMNADLPPEIVIRPAGPGDRDFVEGLVSTLLEFGSPAWQDVDGLLPGFREVLVRAVTAPDPRATVLIAQGADERPLGFISLKIRVDVTGLERGHVADLAVTESARRVGVGTALMRAAESWAREQGTGLLSLDVWSTNDAAVAFYRCLGYCVESLCLIKQLG